MRKIFTPLLLLLSVFTIQTNAQLNVELLGQLDYGGTQLSNLTGWSDGAGHEYAIVGTFDGTSIVDITDPTAPDEVQFVNGNNSIWREVRTWSHYAYVVTEAGGGLLCIDLSNLPGPVTYNFSDGGIGMSTGHTVFCDENGYVHVFGSDIGNGGDQIFNANIDPMDPIFAGEVDTWYIHDGFVRGDTLWAGNIYNGWFSVWDISDKTSPNLLAQQTTPDAFTHNVWLTDDNKYIFTTDEVTNATVASYDVSDLTDIQALDEFRANPGTNSIPHNTMVVGDFLVTAYYRDGVIITDAHYPDNMIKTGWYDTSPLAGDGFNGCWGSWPYLPSGNIIASDMEEGLFILGPTYVSACYLQGVVTDATTGAPIFGADISFTAVGFTDATSDLTGNYHSGVYDAGTYDITFSKPGYLPLTVAGITLTNGVVTIVDAELEPLTPFNITGQVLDAVSGTGIANADVEFTNDLYDYHVMTDASGNFTIEGIFIDDYNLYSGHWGHITSGEDVSVAPGDVFTIVLNRGYYDDFIFDNNWTENGTAETGAWERGEPVGTFNGATESNPELDADDDFSDKAYVTGNGGGGAGTDDVDNGTTNLVSPVFDLSAYADPIVNYERWFYNGGGAGGPNDTLKIFISNGTDEVLMDQIHLPTGAMSSWVPVTFHIADFVSPSANMTIRYRIADQSATGHLLEGGVDKFYVVDNATASPLAAFIADSTVGCAPFVVEFTDNSVGATSWSWDFPGGTPATSLLQNPTITYAAPGTYDVTLTASNAAGSNTTTSTAYITAELCNGIEAVDADGLLSVSPNPFNAFTVITIVDGASAEKAELTDITGKIIRTMDIAGRSSVTIDGKGLAAGVYVLRILQNGVVTGTVKVVKAE